MKYTPPKQTELTLSRTIAASPGEVFDVWIDPRSPGGPWFGATKVLLDARVDGLFYNMLAHEGRQWAHYIWPRIHDADFTTVDPHHW